MKSLVKYLETTAGGECHAVSIKTAGENIPSFPDKQTAPNPPYHLHSVLVNSDVLYLDTSFIACFLT